MTLITDQLHIQECPLGPFEQGNSPGLGDNLARESVFEGLPGRSHPNIVRPAIWASRKLWQSRPLFHSKFRVSRARETTSLTDHLRNARAGLTELMERERRAEQHKNFQKALQWLSENRQRYAGQWLALQGAELVAIGKTAPEVYARVRGQQPPALVVKVDAEELPFAGW